MTIKGNPVPTTTHRKGFFKVSDGLSVRVTADGTYKAGSLVLFGGYLGFLFRDVEAGDEAILSIEQAEYETDQVAFTMDDDEKVYDDLGVGDVVYWDAANEVLTKTKAENRIAGRITAPVDANGVIWFILGPQV